MRRSMVRKSSYGSIYPLVDIISEYKFEDNVLDTVGTNNGTATSISYVTGLVNKAGRFTDTEVDLGSSVDFSMSNGTNDLPKSISFLLKNYDTSNQYIISKNNNGWEWAINYFSGKLSFLLFGSSTSNRIRIDYTFSLTTNIWRHFVFTYDGSANQSGLKLFIDGALISTVASPTGTYTVGATNNSDLLLGQHGLAPSTYSLNGDLDCVRFWDKELSQAEITVIATAELAGTDINP